MASKAHLLRLISHYSGINTFLSLALKQALFCVGYHSIAHKFTPGTQWYADLVINPNEFEEQLKFMQSMGHTFIQFKDIVSLVLKPVYKPTIIYFDDGFKDNLTIALPILKKLNIPATVFVTTGYIDRTHYAPTVYFRYLLEKLDEVASSSRIIEFKKGTYEERRRLIAQLEKQTCQENAWKTMNIFLNWSEVVSLAKEGIEIGSHSLSHTKLTECNEVELENELKNSKNVLESHVAQTVTAFSYPNGRFTPSLWPKLKEAGYQYAVTTAGGFNTIKDLINFPFGLRKIAPKPGDNLVDFRAKLYSEAFYHRLELC